MGAQRDDDEIAAALHGLNAGHHDSTAEHAGGVHGESPDLSPVAPPKPQPVPARPVPQSRPATPPARPAVPVAPPPSPITSVPPPVSSAGRSRPTVPGQPAPTGFDQEVFDDGDETVLEGLPATPLDYRGPRPAPRARPRKPPVFKTLGFRRTVIPVLLTTGVMMLVLFAARWFVDEEAPLALLPTWTGIVLALTGGLLIALAVANMMLVRAELARARVKA